ncbi:MAG: kelch repeat-containing protein [Bryobacteraceae bacterium]
MTPIKPFLTPALVAACYAITALHAQQSAASSWRTLETVAKPHPRHEAAFVAAGKRIYLLGGRRIQPVDIFDPSTRTWTHGAPPPVEVHHFQPVVWEGKIWLVGAMTGKYPHETALDHFPVYDPRTDSWSRGPSLPEDRRRGGAGAVIHRGTLYVICGIINGHWDGHVAWLDALDLRTGKWTRLPDAPRARDHFQAAVIAGKLYAAGGRRSSGATKEVFELVEPAVDVFDPRTSQWTTLASGGNLPVPRAGCMALAVGRYLIVAGGESATQPQAHSNVDALDTRTGRWRQLPTFARGRHGSGLVLIGRTVYVAAGSGNRGGSPELDSTETLVLPDWVR